MSLRLRLILSLACALVGVGSALAYASSVRADAERVRTEAIERFGGEVAQIVVAERTLEAGEVVDERAVTLRDWVADLAPHEAITSLDDVVGQELRVPVAEGVPLTKLNFRDESVLSEVPEGHVAVSVPVSDALGVSRGVARGTHLCAYKVGAEGSRLISADAEVLSELASGQGAVYAQQLTIAVLPEEVLEVLAASTSGELRLVVPADDVGMDERADESPARAAAVEDEQGDTASGKLTDSGDGSERASDLEDVPDQSAEAPKELELEDDAPAKGQTKGAGKAKSADKSKDAGGAKNAGKTDADAKATASGKTDADVNDTSSASTDATNKGDG
jgi:pilus assembly protein CpaB